MPADAPAVKRDATLAAGAEIVAYDRATESREEIAARLAEALGAALVPSFDDVDVIEGQGSAGVEISEQLGGPPDRVLVPCGGGGLSAGIALALPGSEIVTVEPQGWDDMARSLAAGRPLPVEDPAPPTRDALQTKLVSPLTLGALRRPRARGVWVPGGGRAAWPSPRAAANRRRARRAVALAALLAGKAGAVTKRTWWSYPADTSIRPLRAILAAQRRRRAIVGGDRSGPRDAASTCRSIPRAEASVLNSAANASPSCLGRASAAASSKVSSISDRLGRIVSSIRSKASSSCSFESASAMGAKLCLLL